MMLAGCSSGPEPATCEPSAGPDLMVPRLNHAATLDSLGRVLVIGGLDPRGELLDTTEILAPGASTWTAGPRLPRPIADAEAISVGTDVFLVGGQSESGASADVLRWDGTSSTWEPVAVLVAPRVRPAIAAVGDELVVCGGADPPSCEIWSASRGPRDGPSPGLPTISVAAFDPVRRDLVVGGAGPELFAERCSITGAAACRAVGRVPLEIWIRGGFPSYVARDGAIALIGLRSDFGDERLPAPRWLDGDELVSCGEYEHPRDRTAGDMRGDRELVVFAGGAPSVEWFRSCGRSSQSRRRLRARTDRYGHRVVRTRDATLVIGGERDGDRSVGMRSFEPATPIVESYPERLFSSACSHAWR